MNFDDFTDLSLLREKEPRMKEYIDYVIKKYSKNLNNINPNNIILKTDSYKLSQYNMTEDTKFVNGKKERLVGMYASVEPRKGARDSHIIVAGIQNLVKQIKSITVTLNDLHEAIILIAQHFSTPSHDGRYHFNPWPWIKVIYCHDGKIPLKIDGLLEGTILPVGIPIVTIENTDTDCAQLVSHFESLILQCLWYPITCATNAHQYIKVIKLALNTTTTKEVLNSCLPFALQDFALRGTTCMRAAEVGCGAILYVTRGSDTIPAITHTLNTIGNNQMPAFSVAAIEHNQAMMQGCEGEFDQVKRVLEAFPSGILSYVVDTYDMLNCVNKVTSGELKEIIMKRDGTFVIRPDSSLFNSDGTEMTPAETIQEIFKIIETNLGDLIKENSKGFKVLPNPYKIIYGDGLDIRKIKQILELMITNKWCASNIIFGVGGNLAQRIDRDTYRFAMKASEQTFSVETEDGNTSIQVRDVCKETPGKESKKGRFHIALNDSNIPQCFKLGDPAVSDKSNLLETYYYNGEIIKSFDNIEQIRRRVEYWTEVYEKLSK